jgi:hypothetical protein
MLLRNNGCVIERDFENVAINKLSDLKFVSSVYQHSLVPYMHNMVGRENDNHIG